MTTTATTAPSKPAEFTTLTDEDWKDLCEWETAVVDSLGSTPRRNDDWVYWSGSAANRHKKETGGLLWVASPLDGRMMKVDWSYGAYVYKYYPDVKIAQDYKDKLRTLARLG